MIETDLARIASALERIADSMRPQYVLSGVQTHLSLGLDGSVGVADNAQTPEPKEFVKPGPGPGRGKKKPKPEPDDVQKMDTTENPTQEDATASAAEAPDTVTETDTSPASPSEPELTTSPNPTVMPEVTLDDVSRAVVEMAKVKTRDQIMAVWKPFGISRGSELKPEQFFDALMAIKEAMRA